MGARLRFVYIFLLSSVVFGFAVAIPLEDRRVSNQVDSIKDERVKRWSDEDETDVEDDDEGSGDGDRKRRRRTAELDELTFEDDGLLPPSDDDVVASSLEVHESDNFDLIEDGEHGVEKIKVKDEDGHVVHEAILHKREATAPKSNIGNRKTDNDYVVDEQDPDYPPPGGKPRFGQLRSMSDSEGIEDDLDTTDGLELKPYNRRYAGDRKKRGAKVGVIEGPAEKGVDIDVDDPDNGVDDIPAEVLVTDYDLKRHNDWEEIVRDDTTHDNAPHKRSVLVGNIEGPANKKIVIDAIDTGDGDPEVPAVVAVQAHKDSEAAGIESDLDDEIDMPLKPMEEPNTLRKQMTKEKLFPAPANIDVFLDKFDANPKDAIPWKEPKMLTNCWAQAMLHTKRFAPSCNMDGSFSSKQCFLQRCWCVTRQGRPTIKDKMKRFYYKVAGLLLACEQN